MSEPAPTIPGRLTLELGESASAQAKNLGLRNLKGIGPKTEKKLNERGISDQLELLLYVPRKYRPTYRFQPGPMMVRESAEWIEAIGRVVGVIPPKLHGRAPFEVRLDVDGADFKLLWFHLPYRGFDRPFKPGKSVHFEGKVEYRQAVASLSHPTAKVVDSTTRGTPATELVPVYGGIEDIGESILSRAVAEACENLSPLLVEGLPGSLLQDHNLPTIEDALRTIHVLDPVDDLDAFRQQLQKARERLIFQEFFDLQTAMAHRYVAERRAAKATPCSERDLGREMVRNLPFQLTGDQREAIATIADELDSRIPMRRLLQGDVGSGKTVVALMAAAIAIANGVQVAMMAPTDILARQHLRRVAEFFDGLGITWTHLSGSQGAADRRETLQQLKSGAANLVVGTHALFQEGVEFNDLGLIIVDEEHKFGVEQRQALMQLGRDPHLLAMTATPIPRSLAHAVFGDRDLTLIREKPPGRKPIRTVLRDRSRASKIYDYVRDRVKSTGDQAYFVYPLVEASEAVANRRNVMDSAQELANGPLKGLRMGILHGRMDADAKDAVMTRFSRGELDILCATTVIEVGVDVPNATIMVIENAEIFGLSQLHQLRGRVGRGESESMCILVAGYGLTDDAAQRLRAMIETDDGFQLAETDLRIRGPGEFLGMKQAGLPEFRFGDILRDASWLQTARKDARRLILGDAAR